MKPVIGLVPLVDEGRKSLWMLPGYMEGIAGAGGLSFMLPLSGDEADLSRLFSLCDGLLLTGGHDVSPALYGQSPLPVCGACSPERDRMESILLRLAMAENKPVLGICRGLQFMNAALGGSLWQDLPSQHPSGISHHGAPPYDRPVHAVTVLPDTPSPQCWARAAFPSTAIITRRCASLRPVFAPWRSRRTGSWRQPGIRRCTSSGACSGTRSFPSGRMPGAAAFSALLSMPAAAPELRFS